MVRISLPWKSHNLAIFIMLVFLGWSLFVLSKPPAAMREIVAASPDGEMIRLRVALTASQKQKGLSGVAHLSEKDGMIFVFDEIDRYSFWMNGMAIPLDILWLAGETIIELTERVPPPQPGEEPVRMTPKKPVNRIIEVKSGFIEKHGIRVGDVFGLDGLKIK